MIQKFAEDGIRAPKEEKDKLMALTKQDMVQLITMTISLQILKNQIQSGKVTEEQYMNFMKMQVAKDRKLLEFFTSNGLVKKAGIVKERIAIIQAEMQSA